MTNPEDLVPGSHLDAAERDIEAPEADAAEQARTVTEDDGPDSGDPSPAPRFSPDPEVNEADAVGQAHVVHLPDDDYR